MGGISDVAWQRAYRETLENIRSFLETGKAISPVNLAEVKQHSESNGTSTNGIH
jgi:phosphoglycerate dehydrogenase-like enzyme